MSNKVVITGMGAVSPIGLDVESSFAAAKEGKGGIVKVTTFDAESTQIFVAGEVKDFDPSKYINKREARRFALFTQYAVVAAMQAWEQSGIADGEYDADRIGVILGCGMGALDEICLQCNELENNGPRAVSPIFIPKCIINSAAGQVAIRLGLHGPCYAVVTACSSGTDALGQAYYAIKEGRLDAVLVGGTESTMTELAVQGFHQMQALSESKDPKRAMMPFDKDRQGFVMGEGAAFMLIETQEHAEKRGAKSLGEIAGYGQTCDAHHITAPEPSGTYASKAMSNAIKEAGIEPKDIGYINAHGTSTPLNDAFESAAIERCFGEHSKNLLVNSTKSMTGHMLGAAGGAEAIFTILAMRDQVLPPTINLDDPDPDCDLDYVPNTARDAQVNIAISNSFGFGGTNGSLVFSLLS